MIPIRSGLSGIVLGTKRKPSVFGSSENKLMHPKHKLTTRPLHPRINCEAKGCVKAAVVEVILYLSKGSKRRSDMESQGKFCQEDARRHIKRLKVRQANN